MTHWVRNLPKVKKEAVLARRKSWTDMFSSLKWFFGSTCMFVWALCLEINVELVVIFHLFFNHRTLLIKRLLT